MTDSTYPFAAIVGQARLRLALLLAAVDWRLSVLLRGDKGSGKSTAARGLAGILPDGAPFVNLPIGTTEDRLLGGLNLRQALQGEAALKPGLIHEAHGGVLYIDEVNLLADSLADALLDVSSSGRHLVERDGLSGSAQTHFILLGSMNAEEGALRPQLLDRFALALEVEAPVEPEERRSIVQARMRFDANPEGFTAQFEEDQLRLRSQVARARAAVARLSFSEPVLTEISRTIAEAGVRSLRADLAVVRASAAHAALAGRSQVEPADIEAVLPLVLHHRTRTGSTPPPSSPDPTSGAGSQPQEPGNGPAAAMDRVFVPVPIEVPELHPAVRDVTARGRTAAADRPATSDSVNRAAGFESDALDPLASLKQSFRETGVLTLRTDQLVFRHRPARGGARFLFVVDSSGSQAARHRMSAVKGAAMALLESSVEGADEVAVISFRGSRAEIVLQPCRTPEAAGRALEFLPTGGRTPLAHALELARSLVTPAAVVILLTDGRANVPLGSADAWADALENAQRITCPALLIDTAVDHSTSSKTAALSDAMRAEYIRLDDLSAETLLGALQR